LVTDCHSILAGWKKHFSQLLGLMTLGRQKYTAEPLVPEQSAFEVELAIEKLKRYKSPGTDQIPSEFIKAWGKKIRSDVHNLIYCIWNKKELPEGCRESIMVPVYKKGHKRIAVIKESGHFSQLLTILYTAPCCQG
jgi:hypothetical protein